MLKFIFGRPGSGKTYTVLEMIKKLALDGKESILLVPEQFSFESERSVLRALGDKASQKVSVMSFTRLCDEVGRKIGGIAGTTLSGADKVIFMNRALNGVSGELRLWGRYASSVFFAKTMLDTIGEFKINAITPENLRETAETTTSESLKNKLLDIATIYEAFDSLVGERFIDPADNLTKLFRQLEGYKFFEGKTVFIDSFKGFTGQQFKIIDRILASADNTVVSMTYDPTLIKDYNVFHNIRLSIEKIKRSAGRFRVALDEPIILENGYLKSESISALERLLASGEVIKTEQSDITVCEAETITDEAEFTARTIRKLVRENGYRYRDFVIIARDTDPYEEAVYSACRQNNIPLFYDRREQLSAFPLAVAISAAIEYTFKRSSESILRFHKTGMGSLNIDEISLIENYAFLWNIDGAFWEKEWDMNPAGFIATDKIKAESLEKLKNINAIRVKALELLDDFKAKFKGNAFDMSRAIMNLIDKSNMGKKLLLLSNQFKNEEIELRKDILKQSYEKYVNILNSLTVCFGERSLKKQEFFDALTLAVSLESVGVIPRMLDEVSFGAADRIRPSRPKVAFILGANQGVFPENQQSSGILSVLDRQNLISLGVDIPDNRISSAVDENYLVYCNLCCPSDRLYISYSSYSLSGEENEASAFIAKIKDNLSYKGVIEPIREITEENLPETNENAYSQYCKRVLFDNADAETLKAALNGTKEADKIAHLDNVLSGEPKKIKEETAEKLFGKEIRMSASKFDTFHKCRFYFFCKYGLSAKKIQPADFDVLQRGTIVHYVLEKIVTQYKKGLSLLTKEKTDALVEKYINEYLDSVKGYRSIENARMRFLVTRITRALKEVVGKLSREFAQSDFEPTHCELKIGDGGDIPELKIPFDKGEVSLIGSIDRVDEWNGYIRIIDYKTGSKSFKLPDVLFGLNMQMLIYLYAVIRGRGLPDDASAGILYMPSKRELDKALAMNGLIRIEPEIVEAMDKQAAGEFVPKYTLNTNGSLNARCTSFVDADSFTEIFDYIERLVKETGDTILSGDIAISPLDGRETPACKYCDYRAVCGKEDSNCQRVDELKNSEVFSKMREAKENGI